MEVIVMADQGFHARYVQIIKIDLFDHRMRLKYIDQPLGRRLIISRLKILYWHMSAVDSQGTNIHLKSIKMTFMRIEVAPPSQTNVPDSKLPMVACLPLPFYVQQNSQH